MNKFLEKLAERRRFGMHPGLDAIRSLCRVLGDPQDELRAIHVAGTNGKGAVCALLSAALQQGGCGGDEGRSVGRYTSPHLIRLNERFVLNGKPISDEILERLSKDICNVVEQSSEDITFFEALTALAFLAFAEAKVDYAVLEAGLGGRLDATNVCRPELCVITRVGLDHCDWLGDTVEKIAAEKAGIVKAGIPVVLGANDEVVRATISTRAKEVGAPFFYAPDLASEDEMPDGFPLAGAFNRENGVTALAALKVLQRPEAEGFANAVWPGRYQRVGDYLVDGAHNPPAASALTASLNADFPGARMPLVAGFCGDKDVATVLSTLSSRISHGFAVRTNNPRSLSAEATAVLMRDAGIPATTCGSLAEALRLSLSAREPSAPVLVCGSLFLAGEALVELGAYPWGDAESVDPSELLK